MKSLLYLLSSPILYLSLAFIILISCKSERSYINITKILSSYNNNILKEHKLRLLFIVFPMLVSMSINTVDLIDEKIIDSIILSVSILISMFFAYIAFFDEYKSSKTDDASENEILSKTKDESSMIVSYEILISVLLLILCMLYPIVNNNEIQVAIIDDIYLSTKHIYGTIIYFWFIHMLINLLVLLKRYDILKEYK